MRALIYATHARTRQREGGVWDAVIMADALPAALPKEDLDGWRQRWEEGRTGWHKTTVDPVLEVMIALRHKCS